jgi:putative hydrolase of the HAD superfamily
VSPGAWRDDVVLLDALGTLVALEPPVPLLRRELAARHGLELTAAEAERAITAEIAYYRAHHDEASDPARLAALRTRCADVLRDALPTRATAGELGRPGALTEALLASLRFTAFADVRPALEAARASGRRLIVVSNWDVSLHDVLARLDLVRLLDGVVTSAEAGARKPSAAIFQHALALADAGPEQTIHVGDSLTEDVAGARAAGIRAVLVCRRGAPRPKGVRTIAALTELWGGRPATP